MRHLLIISILNIVSLAFCYAILDLFLASTQNSIYPDHNLMEGARKLLIVLAVLYVGSEMAIRIKSPTLKSTSSLAEAVIPNENNQRQAEAVDHTVLPTLEASKPFEEQQDSTSNQHRNSSTRTSELTSVLENESIRHSAKTKYTDETRNSSISVQHEHTDVVHSGEIGPTKRVRVKAKRRIENEHLPVPPQLNHSVSDLVQVSFRHNVRTSRDNGTLLSIPRLAPLGQILGHLKANKKRIKSIEIVYGSDNTTVIDETIAQLALMNIPTKFTLSSSSDSEVKIIIEQAAAVTQKRSNPQEGAYIQ